MSAARWLGFRTNVANVLRTFGATVHSDTEGIGRWAEVMERCATFVATIDDSSCERLELALATLCREYRQEAIAVTYGTTIFVEGAAIGTRNCLTD